MTKRTKFTTLMLSVAVICIIFCFPTMHVSAAGDYSSIFTETFSTSTYRDAGNTNATGWGTGSIRLPSKPVTCVSGKISDAVPKEVDISGNYAFVPSQSKLEVFNIADPLNMYSVANVTRAGMEPNAVDIEGNYLYIAGGNGGFFVYNIATPTSPTYVSSADNGGVYVDVKVSGTTAYCTAYSGGLHVYNVTNPASISRTSGHNDGSTMYGLWIAGNYLYITETSAGLAVYNLTANPKAPVYITKLSLDSDFAKDVQVVGSYAYVSCDLRGMHVVDVANPAAPADVGYLDFPRAYDIHVAGNYAFLAGDDMMGTYNGLVVLDVSVPTAPTHKGTYPLPSGDAALGLIVSGNYTYVCSAFHFDCFDVSPLFHDVYAPSATAQSLQVASRALSSVFVSATVTLTATTPASTQVNLFVSADAGAHWEAATAGVEHLFANQGTSLRWRAVLGSSSPYATPTISDLAINYTFSKIQAPTLVSPADGASVSTPTPQFTWDQLGTLDTYLFQVSVDSTAFTTLAINQTVVGAGPTITFTPASAITGGHVYYWRVAAIDADGNLGEFSPARDVQYSAPAGPDQVSGYAPALIVGVATVAIAVGIHRMRAKGRE
ncbi:MAG: hypothetical protein JW839_19740 [Candidatus Lokiarchaeota archaeon]|nr:hypothetical protein [Candidatus Lokiarchaeota archaeon]